MKKQTVSIYPASPFYRSFPYINLGEACCCFDAGTASFDVFGAGDTKDGVTEYGIYQINEKGFMVVRPVVRLRRSSPFLLSFQDMMKFKNLVFTLGDNVKKIYILAESGDIDAQYLLCWLDAARGNCDQFSDFSAKDFLSAISKFDTSEIEESMMIAANAAA